MKGQRVFGKISGRKYKRTSIVAGQSKNGIVAGCYSRSLRYSLLPPYSPDLNKIEHFWLKNKLRKILPLHVSLDDAIAACFNGE